jgi:hypothetical protein
MPVILPEEFHDVWLSGEAGKEILVPYPAARMKAWPISSRVNSPKNNDAEIVVPVEFNLWRDRRILRNCFDASQTATKAVIISRLARSLNLWRPTS